MDLERFLCFKFYECSVGGLLTSGLTEIVGESGAGKTQLCMQLCLTAQLPRHCHGIGSGKYVF